MSELLPPANIEAEIRVERSVTTRSLSSETEHDSFPITRLLKISTFVIRTSNFSCWKVLRYRCHPRTNHV